MLETAQFQGEQAELNAVLSSGIFHRAPHLVRFLSYICEEYFDGRANQIKEYTIGVEALGRAPEFDPKKDSIVRVEAHRLRRRLSEYYAGAGAGHSIRITIPNGQYIPQFIVQDGKPHTNGDSQPATGESHAYEGTPDAQRSTPVMDSPVLGLNDLGGRHFRLPWPQIAAGLAVVVVFAGLILLVLRQNRRATDGPVNEVWTGGSAEPVPPELRMLAGYRGQPVTDFQGHTWMPDAYYLGGRSTRLPANHRIEGLLDPSLLKTQRSGTFGYDIPLGKGSYELHLYFAETEYGPGNPLGGGEASRTLNVSINGVQRLHDFDPLAESGSPNRLHVRAFKDIVPAADGKLHLAFVPGTAPAFVNAIEIVPSQPGSIRPVRIVAQNRAVTDLDGHFWSADEYFIGGALVLRRNSVLDSREKMLYRGERYGHFAYHIPLAPGKYRLTLHFAETWFGSPESRQPVKGSRLFDVYANGVALLQNFEIAAQGGVNRAVSMEFPDLQPNAQGILCLEFVPVRNYAEVNAIEVVETE